MFKTFRPDEDSEKIEVQFFRMFLLLKHANKTVLKSWRWKALPEGLNDVSSLSPAVCSPSLCPLLSLAAAAQPCNQLIVHEGARTKAAKSRLTGQRGPEPVAGARGLSRRVMACDGLFLTDSVTSFSILDEDFWTLGSCHTAESHDPIDQSALGWRAFQQRGREGASGMRADCGSVVSWSVSIRGLAVQSPD